jgi:hypothetical protein
MNAASDRTTFERLLDLLSDGDWHRKEEVAKVTPYPQHWIRELGESGYQVQVGAEGQVRLLASAAE